MWSAHSGSDTTKRYALQGTAHVDRRHTGMRRPHQDQHRVCVSQYMMARTLAATQYKPRHPELFDAETGWRPEWFAPSFIAAVKDGSDAALRGILKEEVPGIFSFDVFTPAFCDMLQDELNVRAQCRVQPAAVVLPGRCARSVPAMS